MVFKATINVIGKDRQSYLDVNGMSKNLFVVNISQENGRIIERLHVSEEHFNILEPGKEFVLEMVSKSGRNGLYLRTTAVYPTK